MGKDRRFERCWPGKTIYFGRTILLMASLVRSIATVPGTDERVPYYTPSSRALRRASDPGFIPPLVDRFKVDGCGALPTTVAPPFIRSDMV